MVVNRINKIRIMVVDDHAIVRQGFVALINTAPDMVVIVEATDGQQAIDSYRLHKPDITLMDLRLPKKSGVEAIAAIRQEFPNARIIVLTTYDGDEDIYRALQAGARGYLLKDVFFEELQSAIRAVHAGLRHIPTAVAERLAERMTADALTSRELEVLKLIVNGKSNKEIGYALEITEATVKSHINNRPLAKVIKRCRVQNYTTQLSG
jgi:two-component system NarL family response regulator